MYFNEVLYILLNYKTKNKTKKQSEKVLPKKTYFKIEIELSSRLSKNDSFQFESI